MKNVSNWNFLFLFILQLAFASGCKNTGITSDSINSDQSKQAVSAVVISNTLKIGDWGAANDPKNEFKFISALFSVTENGASLDLGCGMGYIPGPIILDGNNSFEVEGQFKHEGGAEPVEGFPTFRALYNGQVVGNKLHLSYSIEGSQAVNTVDLTYGLSGQLLRCL